MRGKTSAAVKNRYNAKTYDRIPLLVPKGCKERIANAARERGKSVNSYITGLIQADIPDAFPMGPDKQQEKGR